MRDDSVAILGLLESKSEEVVELLQNSKRQLFKLICEKNQVIALTALFVASVDTYISSPGVNELANLTYYLRVMATTCREYEFTYLSYCHHSFLSIKKLSTYFQSKLASGANDGDNSSTEQAKECLDEVVASIITSGFPYPNKGIVDLHEYDEKVKNDTFTFSIPDRDNNASINVSVVVRKMQKKMYGEGQQAVGYVMWSAAIILSRILTKYNDTLLAGKTVLEVACGLGLCGITAAHFSDKVTITDFNETVLRQLVKNISVNRGDGIIVEGSLPIINESCDVQVRQLDWDNLSVQKDVAIRYREFNAKEMFTKEKYLNILPHQINENNPCKALSTATTAFPLMDSSAEQFDVIIGSDVVCQATDSLGLVKVMLNFLKIGGIFLCVCPLPHFRYGTEVIIPALHAAGLAVSYAPLYHSTCNAQYAIAHFNTAIEEFLDASSISSTFIDYMSGDDSFLDGLPEIEFTVYMIIHATRVS